MKNPILSQVIKLTASFVLGIIIGVIGTHKDYSGTQSKSAIDFPPIAQIKPSERALQYLSFFIVGKDIELDLSTVANLTSGGMVIKIREGKERITVASLPELKPYFKGGWLVYRLEGCVNIAGTTEESPEPIQLFYRFFDPEDRSYLPSISGLSYGEIIRDPPHYKTRRNLLRGRQRGELAQILRTPLEVIKAEEAGKKVLFLTLERPTPIISLNGL